MRGKATGAAALSLCAGALLSACGSPVAVSAAAPAAEPLPTVTWTYEPETPIGMDLDTIDELFTSPIVDAVVEGTVTSVGFETRRDFYAPLTRIVIAVERSRGTAAREVTVWDSGGIARESELQRAMSRPPKAGASAVDPGPSPTPDRIIDMRPAYGAPRAAVGDKVVVFLHAVTATPEDGYFSVPGTLGRFGYDEVSGDYIRAGTFSKWERVLTRERVDRELAPVT